MGGLFNPKVPPPPPPPRPQPPAEEATFKPAAAKGDKLKELRQKNAGVGKLQIPLSSTKKKKSGLGIPKV